MLSRLAGVGLLGLILFVTGAQAAVAPTATSARPSPPVIKSFADWKVEKVKAAEAGLKSARENLVSVRTKSKGASEPQVTEAMRAVTQAEWDYDVAVDLSVADYVALYLSSASRNALQLKEAAAKLSPEETVKLLEAYLQAIHTQRDEESRLQRHSSLDEDN